MDFTIYNSSWQIRDGSAAEIVGNNPTVVRVHDLIASDEIGFSQEKVMIGLCISMKHSSTSQQNTNQSNFFYKIAKGGNGKRQKVSSSSWSRMYVFADLVQPGKCFVMLYSANTTARTQMKLTLDSGIVGVAFHILEPRTTPDKRHFGPLLMVESSHQLIPLVYPTPIGNMLRNVPCPEQVEPGEQYYFVVTECTSVEIKMFELTSEHSCTGYECDRANQMTSANAFCGCFMTHLSNGKHVGEFDVQFPNCLSRMVHNEEFIAVQKYRSLRTTRLFFRDLSAFSQIYDKKKHFRPVREGVSNCVQYINQHGGWTIAGWFRKGERADMSEETGDRIDNDTVNIHISLMIPTLHNEVKQSEVYRQLKISQLSVAPNNDVPPND